MCPHTRRLISVTYKQRWYQFPHIITRSLGPYCFKHRLIIEGSHLTYTFKLDQLSYSNGPSLPITIRSSLYLPVQKTEWHMPSTQLSNAADWPGFFPTGSITNHRDMIRLSNCDRSEHMKASKSTWIGGIWVTAPRLGYGQTCIFGKLWNVVWILYQWLPTGRRNVGACNHIQKVQNKVRLARLIFGMHSRYRNAYKWT